MLQLPVEGIRPIPLVEGEAFSPLPGTLPKMRRGGREHDVLAAVPCRTLRLSALTNAITQMLDLSVEDGMTLGFPPAMVEALADADFAFAYAVVSACLACEAAGLGAGRSWAEGRVHALRRLPSLWRRGRKSLGAPLAGLVIGLSDVLAPEAGRFDVVSDLEPIPLPQTYTRIISTVAADLALAALRHAFRARIHGIVTVRLGHAARDMVRLQVRDNGHGFNVSHPGRGHRRRSRLCGLIGGEMTIHTFDEGGTSIDVQFPLPRR
jgi:hypothetical protein